MRLASSLVAFRSRSFVVIKQYNAFNTYWSGKGNKMFSYVINLSCTYCFLNFLMCISNHNTSNQVDGLSRSSIYASRYSYIVHEPSPDFFGKTC